MKLPLERKQQWCIAEGKIVNFMMELVNKVEMEEINSLIENKALVVSETNWVKTNQVKDEKFLSKKFEVLISNGP